MRTTKKKPIHQCQNKSIITGMAEIEKKQFDDAIRRLLESALDFHRKQEVKKADLSNRQFQWFSNAPNRWVCHNLSSEGHVCLDQTKRFWCGCIKRQQIEEKSKYFKEFASAIERVETRLLNLADPPETIATSHSPTIKKTEN